MKVSFLALQGMKRFPFMKVDNPFSQGFMTLVSKGLLVVAESRRKHLTESKSMGNKEGNLRCKSCGHLMIVDDGKLRHKQSNHSMYCPCRKPET
jgi:hypothetical protein